MSEESSKTVTRRARRTVWGCLRIFSVMLLLLFAAFRALIFYEREPIRQTNLVEQSRTINLLLFQYANDHDGKYPEGRSSTEVFQKLIDGGYIPEPGTGEVDREVGPNIFYFPMPGKVKPVSKTLKPENVCWDVTCCLDATAPDETPVVYITGYKVNYRTEGNAVPEKWPARTWWGWLTAADYPRGFIVTTYKSNSSHLLEAAPDGSIPHFITPPDREGASFQPLPYHQLTPDGSLP